MDDATSNLLNTANKIVEKELIEQKNIDSSFIKSAAINFLQYVPEQLLQDPTKTYINRRIQQLKKSISHDNAEQSVMDLTLELAQARLDNADEKYKNAKLQFQRALNRFLNQNIKVLYVYSNAKSKEIKLFELSENEEENWLKLDKWRNTWRFSPNKQQLSHPTNVTSTQSTELNNTYFNVLQRARISRRKFNRLGRSNMLFVLWKMNNRWKHMQVSSEGDINEAYAAFYLNKQFSLFGAKIENNINTYMTHKKYGVSMVDNISGLLQGDVTVEGEPNISYAIKSKNASLLGDVDIISIALILKEMPVEKITTDILQSFKSKLAENPAYRNKLNNAITEDTKEILNDIKKDIKRKRLTK